jgi:hypothetical protein
MPCVQGSAAATCSSRPSWRYADPRFGLFNGVEWLAVRPIICRSLGLTIDAGITLEAPSTELDVTRRFS